MSNKVLIQGFRLSNQASKAMVVSFVVESSIEVGKKIAEQIEATLNAVDGDNNYHVIATEQ